MNSRSIRKSGICNRRSHIDCPVDTTDYLLNPILQLFFRIKFLIPGFHYPLSLPKNM